MEYNCRYDASFYGTDAECRNGRTEAEEKKIDGMKIVCKEISEKAFSRVNSIETECWEKKEKRIMNSVGRMWNSSTGDGVLFGDAE